MGQGLIALGFLGVLVSIVVLAWAGIQAARKRSARSFAKKGGIAFAISLAALIFGAVMTPSVATKPQLATASPTVPVTSAAAPATSSVVASIASTTERQPAPASTAASATSTAAPVTSNPATHAPSITATPAQRMPEAAKPRAGCLQALSSLQEAGADTVEPGNPALNKALTDCQDVAQWRGGIESIPAALGYTSKDINAQLIADDLEIVCMGELNLPVCSDAIRLGVLKK